MILHCQPVNMWETQLLPCLSGEIYIWLLRSLCFILYPITRSYMARCLPLIQQTWNLLMVGKKWEFFENTVRQIKSLQPLGTRDYSWNKQFHLCFFLTNQVKVSVHNAFLYFSRAHEIFSKIDHILGHKTGLNKCKRTEIIWNIFSDHNGMKLEFNYVKRTRKFTNMWRLNNMLLNNQWVKDEIKIEIKTIMRNVKCENLWDAVKAVLRGKS